MVPGVVAIPNRLNKILLACSTLENGLVKLFDWIVAVRFYPIHLFVNFFLIHKFFKKVISDAFTYILYPTKSGLQIFVIINLFRDLI